MKRRLSTSFPIAELLKLWCLEAPPKRTAATIIYLMAVMEIHSIDTFLTETEGQFLLTFSKISLEIPH